MGQKLHFIKLSLPSLCLLFRPAEETGLGRIPGPDEVLADTGICMEFWSVMEVIEGGAVKGKAIEGIWFVMDPGRWPLIWDIPKKFDISKESEATKLVLTTLGTKLPDLNCWFRSPVMSTGGSRNRGNLV